jgi:hypothetical protein
MSQKEAESASGQVIRRLEALEDEGSDRVESSL